MSGSRDTPLDGTPPTDRNFDTDPTGTQPTPSVPTPEEPPRFEEASPEAKLSHTPVPVERKAIVGLETTYRSEATGSTTGGHTQRSLPEVERPTSSSSLRVLDGRFQSIEQRLDQLEARLRLLEKQNEKQAGWRIPTWVFWMLVMVAVVALAQLISRRF